MSVYTEEFKQYVASVLAFMRCRTFHQEYSGKVVFMESPYEKESDKDTGVSVNATIEMDTVYLWYKITVYPALFWHWERGDYRTVAENLAHEVCHLFIEPVASALLWDIKGLAKGLVRGIIERQTQRITNTIVGEFKQNWYLPENFAGERCLGPDINNHIQAKPEMGCHVRPKSKGEATCT